MATNLTESVAWGTSVTVPQDGDDAVVSSIVPAFQTLADRTKYLRAEIAAGLIVGGDPIVCNGPSIEVPTIRAAHVGDGGPHYTLFSTAVDASYLESGTEYPTETWLYLYCYKSTGRNLAFQLSTTPRDASGVWKNTGVGTHRFVCSVYSHSSAAGLRPFVKVGRTVTYRDNVSTNVLHNSTSFAWVSFGTSNPLPPGTRGSYWHASVDQLGSGGMVQVRYGSSGNARYVAGSSSTAPYGGVEFSQVVNPDSNFATPFQYAVGSSGQTVVLLCRGYDE